MTQDLSKKTQEVVEEDAEVVPPVLSAPVPAYMYLALPAPSPISNLTRALNKERGLNCKIRTLPKTKDKVKDDEVEKDDVD